MEIDRKSSKGVAMKNLKRYLAAGTPPGANSATLNI
jgi:hypothetical protein